LDGHQIRWSFFPKRKNKITGEDSIDGKSEVRLRRQDRGGRATFVGGGKSLLFFWVLSLSSSGATFQAGFTLLKKGDSPFPLSTPAPPSAKGPWGGTSFLGLWCLVRPSNIG